MKIVIEGVPPWDGSYDFDSLGALSNREGHRIKEISGVRAGELLDALRAGDAGAWVALSVVIMARHGKTVDPDDLWDASLNAIDFDPEADADPPTPLPVEPGQSGSTVLSGVASGSGGG